MMLALAPLVSAQMGKMEQQVLQAEKDRFAAMVKGDRAALEKLLADDLTYTHSTALFESKEQFIKSVTSGNIDYVSIVPSEADWKVRVNGNTAIVNGLAAVNVIDTGKDLKIRIRYTTIQPIAAAAWQLQAWQSTRFPSVQQIYLDGERRLRSISLHRCTSCLECCGGKARLAGGALSLSCLAALSAQITSPAAYLSHAQAAPVFAALDESLPDSGRMGPLDRNSRCRHASARRTGRRDSIVNLLLFGTSFTTQPRMTSRQLDGETDRSGCEERIRDFERALALPGSNERLQFARRVLADGAPVKARLLSMIDRSMKEEATHAGLIEQAHALGDPSLEFAERSRMYRGPGAGFGHVRSSQFCRRRGIAAHRGGRAGSRRAACCHHRSGARCRG